MSVDVTSSATAASQPPATPAAGAASSDWDFSFHNLLDIINPLQHLPIVGTIYRAITGSHIGIPEKIAGDALYGGLWGAVSGAADAAFEAVTGKDFGSTVLALFQGSSHSSAQLAQVTVTPAAQLPTSAATATRSSPLQTSSAQQTSSQNGALNALQSSLTRQGVDSDLAQRAIAAYRKSITLPALVPQTAS